MRYSSIEEQKLINEKAWKYYIKYIKSLSEQLNIYHGTTHSVRYWKLTIGKWLWDYVMLLYGQYDLIAKQDKLDSVRLDVQKENFSRGDDLRHYVKDVMYLQIVKKYVYYYAAAYRKYGDANVVIAWKDDVHNVNRYSLMNYSSWEMANTAVSAMVEDLMDSRTRFVFKQNLKKNNIELLSLVLDNNDFVDMDIVFRQSIFGEVNDEFDFVFWKSLQWNLPQIYVEKYNMVCTCVLISYPHKKFSSIYVVDATDYAFYVLDFYIAMQVEIFNCKLIDIQHGGVYGMSAINGCLQFEQDISDKFISWGWQGENVIPMPNLLLEKAKFVKKKNQENVLYITTIEILERGFFGGLLSMDFYRNWIIAFLQQILKNQSITVEWRSFQCRLPGSNNDQLEDVLRVLGEDSKRLLVNCTGSFYDRLADARLVVIDHCSTTMLETIGANIPTVLFWNRTELALTDEAELMLNKLKMVNIFHDTPEGAAEFVQTIYSNPLVWWNSDKVKAVRQEFVMKFSRQDEDIMSSYIALFKTGKVYNGGCARKKIESYNKDWRYWLFCCKLNAHRYGHHMKMLIKDNQCKWRALNDK